FTSCALRRIATFSSAASSGSKLSGAFRTRISVWFFRLSLLKTADIFRSYISPRCSSCSNAEQFRNLRHRAYQMVVRELLQLPALARSRGHADDQAAAGVSAFEQIGRRVADFGHAPRVRDSQLQHQAPNHIGVRASVFNLVAAHRGVERLTIGPT